ncbi:MAG: hypothetical protein DRH21_04000 [Deltaproteobacteria bacterium]|nr:MAG: hypothetical protein DRH21_04000 [Deltaproteobacteria bacterium]
MYVRLAFAVAAHLEPEILLVDEVLAVGDAAFQKKCLGKMRDVAYDGRTILFVSHNMQAVRQLCGRTLLINRGMVTADDKTANVIPKYLQGNGDRQEKSIEEVIRSLLPDPVFKFDDIRLTQEGQRVGEIIENGKTLEIEIQFSVFKKTTGLRVYFDLCDDQDTILFRSFNDEGVEGIPTVEAGKYVSNVTLPADLLSPTFYNLRILSTIFNVRTFYPEGINITLNVERTGTANQAYKSEPIRGKLAPVLKWTTDRL